MNFWKAFLLAAFFLGTFPRNSLRAEETTIQFWGDTFISWQMTKKYSLKTGGYDIFTGVGEQLAAAQINVANFEGVATGTTFPLVPKRFLLPMPLFVDRILVDANIRVLTLANNHTMDFGRLGLVDTLATLNRSQLKYVGAGLSEEDAIKPLVLHTAAGSICLLNFSRVLPNEHWASGENAGTANLNFTKTAQQIAACANAHSYTFVVYHWGAESSHVVKKYQRKLARLSIDNGAHAVVGHHPHVLQPMEVYKDKPIFYSLGNFAFASNPRSNIQEGMAVRMHLGEKKIRKLELIPIKVAFPKVQGRPQTFSKDVTTTFLDEYVDASACKRTKSYGIWQC